MQNLLCLNCVKSFYLLFTYSKAVSTALGTGIVRRVPYETCMLDKSITKIEYELLKINVRITSGTIKEFPRPLKYEVSFTIYFKQRMDSLKMYRLLSRNTSNSGTSFQSELFFTAHQEFGNLNMQSLSQNIMQFLLSSQMSLRYPHCQTTNHVLVEKMTRKSNRYYRK